MDWNLFEADCPPDLQDYPEAGTIVERAQCRGVYREVMPFHPLGPVDAQQGLVVAVSGRIPVLVQRWRS